MVEKSKVFKLVKEIPEKLMQEVLSNSGFYEAKENSEKNIRDSRMNEFFSGIFDNFANLRGGKNLQDKIYMVNKLLELKQEENPKGNEFIEQIKENKKSLKKIIEKDIHEDHIFRRTENKEKLAEQYLDPINFLHPTKKVLELYYGIGDNEIHSGQEVMGTPGLKVNPVKGRYGLAKKALYSFPKFGLFSYGEIKRKIDKKGGILGDSLAKKGLEKIAKEKGFINEKVKRLDKDSIIYSPGKGYFIGSTIAQEDISKKLPKKVARRLSKKGMYKVGDFNNCRPEFLEIVVPEKYVECIKEYLNNPY